MSSVAEFVKKASNKLQLGRFLLDAREIPLSWSDLIGKDWVIRNMLIGTQDLSLSNAANASLQAAVISLTEENRSLRAGFQKWWRRRTICTTYFSRCAKLSQLRLQERRGAYVTLVMMTNQILLVVVVVVLNVQRRFLTQSLDPSLRFCITVKACRVLRCMRFWPVMYFINSGRSHPGTHVRIHRN